MADPNEGAAALEAAYIAAFDMLETDGTPMHPAKGTLLDAVRAALSAYLGALSDTHRLVPEDPDEAMGLAGGCVLSGDDAPYPHEIGNAVCVWDAMLAKAPSPPGLKEPEHD